MPLKENINNFNESWGNFLETFQEQNQRMTETFFKGMQQQLPFPPTVMGDVFIKTAQALLKNPSHLLNAQEKLLGEVQSLWKKMLIPEEENNSPISSDKRFRHDAWKNQPYFLFMKEYYLITSRWLQKLVSELEGLDHKTASKIQFYMKQLTEAVSPTNFPLTNPEVLEEFMNSNGDSLRKGFEALMKDMEGGQWMKMTDPSAFEVGKNIASTQGEVVFRNKLFELIHYAPRTKKQYSIPLLIIPPWINKYYIFDLTPKNSFVKWMIEKGYNVYIVSWINPDPEFASKTFEDYLLEGAYQACEKVSALSGSPSLHGMGYCVGGNLLTALNAYLSKSPSNFSLQTMTLLATIVDFTKVGDLKVFMDDEHLQYIEEMMTQKGVLDAEVMKSIFSMLRPNELVWSFFIKNYLLGQVPPAFDFLYWNSDATRLPANLHRFILRKYFQKNLFMKPGGIHIKETPLNLQEITTPTFLLSTQEDHISPWESTYPATHLFKGPVEFVLAGSGHVAGVINPPSQNKYYFYTNPDFPESVNEWLEMATKNEGSWWTKWDEWTSSLSGEKINPILPKVSLGEAPGSYVRRH